MKGLVQMDKYEFNIKIEQIKKLMKRKDFATAVKIADTIDWRKVRENQLLIMAADVYEIDGRYDAAREALLLAYERTGLGRQLAYRLCRLSVKRGDFTEAEEFYEEFTENSPRDAGRYILQYEMSKGKGETLDKQIQILETFIEEDMDDRWAYELAKLYHKAHLGDKCVELCDTIILWFADGKYVEKAMELKQLYVPLSENQRIKYEAQKSKKSAVVESIIPEKAELEDVQVETEDERTEENVEAVAEDENSQEEQEAAGEPEQDEPLPEDSEETVEKDILDKVHEPDIDVNSIHVRDFSVNNKYDTMNLQRELAKSVSSMFDNTIEIFKPTPAKSEPETEENPVDDQIEGQMSLDEVLAMFEAGEFKTEKEVQPEKKKPEAVHEDEEAMDTDAEAAEDQYAETEDIEIGDIEVEYVEVEDIEVEDIEIADTEVEDIEVEDVEAEDTEVEETENEDSDDQYEEFEELQDIDDDYLEEAYLDSEEEDEEELDEVSQLASVIAEEIRDDIDREIQEEVTEELVTEPEDEDGGEAEFEVQETESIMFNLKEEIGTEEIDTEEIVTEEDQSQETEEISETVEETPVKKEKQSDIAKRELKNFISKFTGVQGLDKQILKVMQSVLKTDTEPVKFIFIKGEVKSGKTTLAIDVIKLANKIIQRRDQRIAKIKGISLNDKPIDSLLEVLDGSDVLIERVSDVEPEVFAQFIDELKAEGKPRVVIFEDEKSLADAFLNNVPAGYGEFVNTIDIKVNKIKDWAKVAKDYAKSKGYIIDEMGTLALSAKIDQLRAITLVVHKNHVEQLIDCAIEKANKPTFKSMIGKLFGRDKEGMKVLTEKDFVD